MPTTFHDREQAFEAKFAHDEEFRFLVLARRDKLFARWAADTHGLPAEDADSLVRTVLAIPNGHRHDEAVLRHVESFLSSHDSRREDDLRTVLDRCMQDAAEQLAAGPPRQPTTP